ncbi:MAG: hypothetical protein JO097_07590, partial [Acidobacteriaceae bacterium]|nr:hypothetical protein [Acidobacteriaceae bacterium]
MRGTIVSLCLSHLIGNALLLWLGYYWLGIGESDAAHLLWSALVILILLCSGLWLHGTGLTFFRQNTNVQTAARTALRNLLPLFVLCLAAVIIYGLLMYWRNHFGHSAFVIGSYATMKLRKPVAPSGVLLGFHVLIWLLRWLVAPSLLLPVAASVAVSGWVGFARPWKRGNQLLYWIEVCALLVCA